MKKYKVLIEDNYEYDIVVEKNTKGTKYSLFYNDMDIWTLHTKSKLVLSMFDNGNNVKISKVKQRMEYDEFFNLRILLNLESQFNDLDQMKIKYIEIK